MALRLEVPSPLYAGDHDLHVECGLTYTHGEVQGIVDSANAEFARLEAELEGGPLSREDRIRRLADRYAGDHAMTSYASTVAWATRGKENLTIGDVLLREAARRIDELNAGCVPPV